MKRVLLFVSVWVVVGLGLPAVAQTSIGVTPGWLRFLANGSEGAYSCSSGTCFLTDEHWYSSFTVSAGATAYTRAGNGPTIIRSTGACTIAGTLANSPNTLPGSTGISGSGDFGGGGGGGGAGGSVNGQSGHTSSGNAFEPLVNGGIGGIAPGGSGGAGVSSVFPQYHALLSSGSYWAGGGSLGGNGGGPLGTIGGNGGGVVILVCESINFTGTIDVSGGPGKPSGGTNSGAGAGGGGGYAILSADTYVVNSGVIKSGGGPGGGCNGVGGCGAGGKGGDGWSMEITIQ